MMYRITWLVFFQLPYCSLLLTITWIAVFVALPPYLRNDHLPVKGPCESHYPWSNRQWQGKGMERTDVRWQALCFLMLPLHVSREKTHSPLLLQRIHRARKVIRPLQRQNLGLCFLFWKSHIFSHWCAPWRTVYQLCTRYNPGHKGLEGSLLTRRMFHDIWLWCFCWVLLTSGMFLRCNVLFCLCMHEQALFW